MVSNDGNEVGLTSILDRRQFFRVHVCVVAIQQTATRFTCSVLDGTDADGEKLYVLMQPVNPAAAAAAV